MTRQRRGPASGGPARGREASGGGVDRDDPRLAHVAVIVRSLEEGTDTFGRRLGLSPAGREVLPEQGAGVSLFQAGSGQVELLEPLDPGSSLGRFLAARGEGVHHLAFEVPDLAAALERARAAGLRLIDEQPRGGAHGTRIAFLHPSGTNAVLVELVQRSG